MKKTTRPLLIILYFALIIRLIALTAFAFDVSPGQTNLFNDDHMTALQSVPEITDSTGGYCGADADGKNVTWRLSKTGVLTISGTGAMCEFDLGAPWYPYAPKIKAAVFEGGSKVTNISDMAFYGLTGITAFIVPKSIETIGSAAFAGCSNLRSVSLPYGLNFIGDSAFYACIALEKIVIPDTVTVISDCAFGGCEVLSSATLSKNTTYIGDNAFGECRRLKAVNIPEGVEHIGVNAFARCVALREINLPESLKSIGSYAFGGCTSLRDFDLPGGVTELGDNPVTGCKSISYITVDGANSWYCSAGGVLYNKDMTRLIAYPPAKLGASYDIPETVTEIGSDAFYGCRYIASMVIPANVRTIGDSAFERSRSLITVTIPLTVSKIGRNAFLKDTDPNTEQDEPEPTALEVSEEPLTIIGCNGSQAHKHAVRFRINFRTMIDLNINCTEDPEDASLLINHITGRSPLPESLLDAADGDGDGFIDIRDYNRLYANINK